MYIYDITSLDMYFITNIVIISGEAEAILARARATAEGLALVSQTLKENGGLEVRFFYLLMLHILEFTLAVKCKLMSSIHGWLMYIAHF